MHWTRVRETRYNRRYKYLTPGTLPKYLRKRRKNGEQRILARARCGSTENAKFWVKEVERECPLCEEEEGTFETMQRNRRSRSQHGKDPSGRG